MTKIQDAVDREVQALEDAIELEQSPVETLLDETIGENPLDPETPEPVKTDVLMKAHQLIHGDRQRDYGSPLKSFTKIAELWSPILGLDITAEEVALCMIGLKIARATQGYQVDSLVDIAGYAGCIELIQNERDS